MKILTAKTDSAFGRVALCAIAFLLLTVSGNVWGEVIHLTDGRKIIGNIAFKGADAIKVEAVKRDYVIALNDVYGVSQSRIDQEKLKEASLNDVEIFVTTWCPICVDLKDFLNKNNIQFKAYDVEKTIYGKQIYANVNAKAVPIVKIGAKVLPGFDPELILQTLKEEN